MSVDILILYQALVKQKWTSIFPIWESGTELKVAQRSMDIVFTEWSCGKDLCRILCPVSRREWAIWSGKMSILKAYKLVQESYWQRFRNTKKTEKQTYIEFGREKEMLFDRWCLSKKINQDYMRLCELMLNEKFKNCLPADIKIYIDKQKIENLHQAAALADDYALTHKPLFGRVFQSSRENQRSTGDSHPILISKSKDHNKPTHQSPWFPSGPTCFYCKKKGHILSECWALEKKNQRLSTHMLVATKGSRVNHSRTPDCKPFLNSDSQIPPLMDTHHLFPKELFILKAVRKRPLIFFGTLVQHNIWFWVVSCHSPRSLWQE